MLFVCCGHLFCDLYVVDSFLPAFNLLISLLFSSPPSSFFFSFCCRHAVAWEWPVAGLWQEAVSRHCSCWRGARPVRRGALRPGRVPGPRPHDQRRGRVGLFIYFFFFWGKKKRKNGLFLFLFLLLLLFYYSGWSWKPSRKCRLTTFAPCMPTSCFPAALPWWKVCCAFKKINK